MRLPYVSEQDSFNMDAHSHYKSFADLKRDMIRQGNHYVQEALSYRSKIAELVVDELVVQDDAVVCHPMFFLLFLLAVQPLIPSAGLALHGLDSDTLVFASRYGSIGAGPQAKTDLRSKIRSKAAMPVLIFHPSVRHRGKTSQSRARAISDLSGSRLIFFLFHPLQNQDGGTPHGSWHS